MNKIRIDRDTDTGSVFGSPVVVNGLKNGFIDCLEVVARRNDAAEFLCLVVNSPGLIINRLILKGWKINSIQDWKEFAPSGLLVAPDSPGVIVRKIAVSDVVTGFRLESEGSRVEHGSIVRFAGDGFQLCNHDAMALDLSLSDSLLVFDGLHRDVGQLYRKGSNGGLLRGCVVEDVRYMSTGHAMGRVPQGILASDSVIRDCIVRNCDLQDVHELHGISMLLDAKGCTVTGNKTNGLIRVPYQNIIEGNDAQVVPYVRYLTKRVDFMNKKIGVTAGTIQSAAAELGIQPAKVRAFIRVEDGDIDRILFERHVFYRSLQKLGVDISALLQDSPELSEIINPSPYTSKRGKRGPDYYGNYEDSKRRLRWATTIHKEAAYCSISVGYFQLMGHQFNVCGYSTAYEFVSALMEDSDAQVRAVIAVIRDMGVDDELRRDDFSGFARRYVGPGYKRGTKTVTDDYDWKFAKFYRQELGRDLPGKPMRKSKTMRSAAAGTLLTGGGAVVMSGNIPSTEAINSMLNYVSSNADKLSDISEKVAQINESVDAMSWLPWMVGGFGLVTVAMLLIIAYAYLTDNGHIKGFSSLEELG